MSEKWTPITHPVWAIKQPKKETIKKPIKKVKNEYEMTHYTPEDYVQIVRDFAENIISFDEYKRRLKLIGKDIE